MLKSPEKGYWKSDLHSFASKKVNQFLPFLIALREALEYAEDLSSSPWDFALCFDQARAFNINGNDLRWMVRKGWLKRRTKNGELVQETLSMDVQQGSEFILSEVGLSFFDQDTVVHEEVDSYEFCDFDDKRQPCGMSKPNWNFERRELQIDGKVVKRFRAPAPNQETILSVFSEENWPARIEDPLTQCPGQDPKRRLGDTIKCLNRNQHEKLIRFRGDGTGAGVLWEIIERD